MNDPHIGSTSRAHIRSAIRQWHDDVRIVQRRREIPKRIPRRRAVIVQLYNDAVGRGTFVQGPHHQQLWNERHPGELKTHVKAWSGRYLWDIVCVPISDSLDIGHIPDRGSPRRFRQRGRHGNPWLLQGVRYRQTPLFERATELLLIEARPVRDREPRGVDVHRRPAGVDSTRISPTRQSPADASVSFSRICRPVNRTSVGFASVTAWLLSVAVG